MTDLAKRLLACPRFRWMPRMRVFSEREGEPWFQTIPERFSEPCDGRLWLPDLTDPATLGCLLHLVEERYGSGCYVRNLNGGLHGDGWAVFLDDEALTRPHQTQAHALVAALEAA